MPRKKNLSEFENELKQYILSLQDRESPWKFSFCRQGLTPLGEEIRLAPSCFGLKLFKILSLWEIQPQRVQEEWISYLHSFQQIGARKESLILSNAFVDPVILSRHTHPTFFDQVNSFRSRSIIEIYRNFFKNDPIDRFEKYIVAETKQTLATLHEVGKKPLNSYKCYPHDPQLAYSYVSSFDWRLPWGAGGQTSATCAFIALDSEESETESAAEELIEGIYKFYTTIADPESGGYFDGPRPSYSMLINGAMKVLTGLDWLNKPIHYPCVLLKTAVKELPRPDGCNLVDCVYVIYRCINEMEKPIEDMKKVMDYLDEIVELIWMHHNVDGGFSYAIGAAQRWYYGMRISRGLNESDIHGTILLVWALAMIFELKQEKLGWQVIRP